VSYIKIAQFLSALGLIFIQPLNGFDPSKPVHLFAEKLEGAPDGEFYDIVKVGGTVYLAGSGLIRVRDGDWEAVFEDGRYTALCADPQGRGVWYAGPKSIGLLADEEGAGVEYELNIGYIWDLVADPDKVWFFGANGYGFVDINSGKIGAVLSHGFAPRPIVFDVWGELFVSDEGGLFRVGPMGLELVVDGAVTGPGIVSWLVRDGDRYLFGTPEAAFLWAGPGGGDPVVLENNYSDYFNKGVSNAVISGGWLVITDYPGGLALWDLSTDRISGYVGPESGLTIGDVYKVRRSEDAGILVLGTEGVGSVDLALPHRFLPEGLLWQSHNYRASIDWEESGIVIFEDTWLVMTADGVRVEALKGNPFWISRDPAGRIVAGDSYSYEVLLNGDWEQRFLKFPVFDLMWGRAMGYATRIRWSLAKPQDSPIGIRDLAEDGRTPVAET